VGKRWGNQVREGRREKGREGGGEKGEKGIGKRGRGEKGGKKRSRDGGRRRKEGGEGRGRRKEEGKGKREKGWISRHRSYDLAFTRSAAPGTITPWLGGRVSNAVWRPRRS